MLRRARRDDLPAILRLSGDAPTAMGVPEPEASASIDPAARAAFDAIDVDPDQMLVVAETPDRVVRAVLHLAFEHAGSGRGKRRARLLGLKVDPSLA
ncbi:MAG: hypothetical protein WCK28_03380, partial [Burkholderiales bacterium]